MINDDISLIEPNLQALQSGFRMGKTRSLEYRKQGLRNMIRGLNEMAQQFIEAYQIDLGYREPYLTRSSHIGSVINDAQFIIENMDKWAKRRESDCNLFIGGGEAYVIPEPYGVCLVLGTWNFPLPLCLKPAAAAISAGNCVLIKPSEHAPNISNVLKKMFDKYMDPDCFRVLEGGVQVSSKICSFAWDLIFFTGGSAIGKLVAKAAAENLVPCILELGGKSPTIVDEDADVVSAALRIGNTKLTNCGQICVAPDYVYVHNSKIDQFIQETIKRWRQFYGDNPQQSKDYGRIINAFHTNRIGKLIQDQHGGKIVYGGTVDINDRYVQPTIVLNPKLDSLMMQEEIFGPLLPILVYDSIDQVIQYINSKPKPLALYYFGSRHANQIISQTSAGGVLINDCFFHLLNDELPFGGVGNSGYGAYHGIYGFDNCSHLKPVMRKNNYNGFPYNQRFPPFTPQKMQWMRKLSVYGSKVYVRKHTQYLVLLLLLVVAAILTRIFSSSQPDQDL